MTLQNKKLIIIYMLTASNGKSYIGQTKNGLLKRIRYHMMSDFLIGRAICKYNLKDFRISILWQTINKQIANMIEIAAIDFHNTYKLNGYNLTHGGEGGDTQSGIKRFEETKMKMRVPKSDAHKLAIKMSCPNRNGTMNPNYGKKHESVSEANSKRIWSDESKKKMSDANKGKKSPEQSRRMKKNNPMDKLEVKIKRLKNRLEKELKGGD